MKLRSILLYPLISCSLLMAATTADQECGTSYYAGIIAPGSYSGVGDTCAEARADLREDMMGALPDCEGCPPGEAGCNARNVPDDPNNNVVEGNCSLDPVTGKWTVPGTVSASTPFDAHCTSCKASQGRALVARPRATKQCLCRPVHAYEDLSSIVPVCLPSCSHCSIDVA